MTELEYRVKMTAPLTAPPLPLPESKVTWPRTRLEDGTAGLSPSPDSNVKHAKRKHAAQKKVAERLLRYRASPHSDVTVSDPITSVTESETLPMALEPAPDQLASARYTGGTSIWVQFWDGLEATVDVGKFGLDLSRLHLTTARAGPYGSAVEIRDVSGDVLDIDSSVFRSHADPKYAAELEAVIAGYHAEGGRQSPRR